MGARNKRVIVLSRNICKLDEAERRIYASINLAICGSDNDSSPDGRQAEN